MTIEFDCFTVQRSIAGADGTEINDFVAKPGAPPGVDRLGVGPDPEYSRVLAELITSCVALAGSIDAERFSVAADPDVGPQMPDRVTQHMASGPPERYTIRVFADDTAHSTPELRGPMNGCAKGYWTATWRALSEEVELSAWPLFGAYFDEPRPELFGLSIGSPPTTSGVLGAPYVNSLPSPSSPPRSARWSMLSCYINAGSPRRSPQRKSARTEVRSNHTMQSIAPPNGDLWAVSGHPITTNGSGEVPDSWALRVLAPPQDPHRLLVWAAHMPGFPH